MLVLRCTVLLQLLLLLKLLQLQTGSCLFALTPMKVHIVSACLPKKLFRPRGSEIGMVDGSVNMHVVLCIQLRPKIRSQKKWAIPPLMRLPR